MSLLRRRMMMQEQKIEESHVIYVYSGYIGMTEDKEHIPTYNESYPNSVATSSIKIEANDAFAANYTGGSQQRTRLYDENGKCHDTTYSTKGTATKNGYIRFVWHTGAETVDSVTVTKEDGTVIDYKIIDLR